MKARLFLALSLVLLAALIGWRFTQKRAELQAQTGQRSSRMRMAPAVTTAVARLGDVPQVLADVGSVEAPLSVKLAPKVAGRITYLTVHEGDRVRRGQVLVRIDPAEVEAQVRQARAALAEQQYRLAQARITQSPANVSVATQCAGSRRRCRAPGPTPSR